MKQRRGWIYKKRASASFVIRHCWFRARQVDRWNNHGLGGVNRISTV